MSVLILQETPRNDVLGFLPVCLLVTTDVLYDTLSWILSVHKF